MNTLYDEIYGVLNRYGIEWNSNGVSENFRKWERHKKNLVDLLSKHPQWNRDAMAIIFDITENREINVDTVFSCKYDLLDLARDIELTDKQREDFRYAIIRACEKCTRTIASDCIAETIKNTTGVKCVTGQKTSKVINAICIKFGIDKHTEYNKCFAKLADSLSPLQVKKKALLSVHPCDYLEMSSDQNSWESCHRINGGQYQAGVLSYMNDGATMIFYTVDDDVTNKFFNVPKRTRQVFAYENNILLQSKLYPNCDDDDARNNYRNIVQSAIAKCLNQSNLWKLEREKISSYILTNEEALHYRDYEYHYNKPNVSLLKNKNDEYENIIIGYDAYCLNCAGQITENKVLHCDYCCDDYYFCMRCESRIGEDNVIYVDDYSYCRDCVEYCGHCSEYFSGDSFRVRNRNGYKIDVCEGCAMEDFSFCDDCGTYYHYDNMNYIDNGTYCNDCFAEKYYSCANCEDAIDKDDAIIINSDPYCVSCFDNNFTVCNMCIEPVDDDDVIEIDEKKYCQHCADEIKAELKKSNEYEEAA